MRTIEVLLTSPAVYRIGWALLHSLWQSTAVALLLAVMLRRLRRAPAESRYLAACVALAMMVALPAATSSLLAPAPGSVDSVGSFARARRPDAIGGVPQDVVTIGPRSSPRPFWLPPWAQPRALLCGLVAAWFVGVTVLTLRLLGGWLMVRRLTRRARPLTGPCEEVLVRLARALQVRRAVCLLESSLVQVPMVIGGLRPVILLPVAALTGLLPSQLEALLAHELAHIRRHDYLVNLVQSVIEVLLFYHPAAWWAARIIRAEREHCCDDLAIQTCGDRLAYAWALAAMEGLRGSSRLSMAVSGGPLLTRVRRILNPEVQSMDRLPIRAPGAALLIGALLLSAAPAHFQELDRPAGATPENARTHSAEQSRPDRDLVIHTVFVPVFRSNSFCRDVQLLLTEAVTKEIEERTRYKVVGTLDEADAILEGTVNTADKNLVVEDPLNLPRPFSAQIVASLRWIHNPPLESERKAPPMIFSQWLTFHPEVGETSKPAFYRMCQSLARQMVVMRSVPRDGDPDFSVPTLKTIEPKLKVAIAGQAKRFTDTIATYSITVEDPGTATAHNVRMRATLPLSGRLVGPAPDGARWDPSTGELLWTIPQVEPGEKAKVTRTFQVRMGGIGLYEVTVDARGDGGLSDHTNCWTDVLGLADVEFEVLGQRRVVDVGDATRFSIRIKNIGTKDATNLLVRAMYSKKSSRTWRPSRSPRPTREAMAGALIRRSYRSAASRFRWPVP